MNSYSEQYIAGEWVIGSGGIEMKNYNPYSGELLYTYQSAGRQDVDRAYKAAREAQKEWAAFLPAQKQHVLEKAVENIVSMKDEIYSVLTEEGGSPRAKADFEYFTIISIIKNCMKFPDMMEGKILPSNIPGKDNFIFRVPKGVIGVIAPWNVPLVLSMRSVVPAIAAGNGVVLKPSSDTPASASIVAKIFENTGIPKGLFNFVTGAGSEIGDYFVTHPIPDLISFTGSTKVGHRIGEMAGKELKEVSLELGGNNVMIVLKDADLEAAAKAGAFGSCFNQGQVCMAINRFLVDDRIHDLFTEALIQETKKLKVGNPSEDDTFIGPIINEGQVSIIRTLIENSIKEGAIAPLEGKFEGNMVYPWVLTGVTNDMSVAKNEVFGPVSSIIRFDSEEEAVSMANDTEYGLSGSVFTGDLYHGMQIAKKLDTGMVHINDQSINDEPNVMFGGVKASGIGRFNDRWVLEKFTTDRWISVQTKYRF